jgi:hypothetical protein
MFNRKSSAPTFLGRHKTKIFGSLIGVISTLVLLSWLGRRKTTQELGVEREQTDTFYPAV